MYLSSINPVTVKFFVCFLSHHDAPNMSLDTRLPTDPRDIYLLKFLSSCYV